MSESKTSSPAGKFVWYEWMGEDVKAAADFYAHVVGWTAKNTAGTGERPYTVLSAGAYGVAGMITISTEAKALGAPPCWAGYIWVEDVDSAAAKLVAAGGAAKRAPSDIPGVGRFAVVTDPQGVYFRLFRDAGGNPPPPPAPDALGLVGWRELHANDGAKAFDFYADLFGWTKRRGKDMGAMGVYQLFGFAGGDSDVGGIMTRTPQTSGPFWLFYFNVPAIDAAAERVKAKGGKIVNGPMEVPGGQWIVQATDLEGALFALVAPKR
jgi:predicted enzyme related to lactoylglutathione lyase